MRQENQNNNVFMQVSKLFGKKPQPPVPRMTCTRLRRFRETRQNLVVEAEFGPHNELTQTCDPTEDIASKKESFADWVVRNQQEHQQALDKQNQSHEEIKTINEKDDANKTVQGFASFSSSALQEVAKKS